MGRGMLGLGVEQLYLCEGTMKLEQYVRVLSHHMLAVAIYGEGETFNSPQDNAPCHKSNHTF